MFNSIGFFPNKQGFRCCFFFNCCRFLPIIGHYFDPAFIHSHFKNFFDLIYAKMWEEENCIVGVFDTFWIVLFTVFSKVIENIRHSYEDIRHSYEDIRHSYEDIRHSYENIRHSYEDTRHLYENIRHSYGHSAEYLFTTWLLFSMSTIRLL